LVDTAENPAALYVAIISGMKHSWHELEGTGVSDGETSLSLNPSKGHLAPLVGDRPQRPRRPRRLLTASVPRTLELKKVD